MSRQASVKRVGAMTLMDLEVLCEQRGRESLPHPFAHLHPSPFADLDEYHRYGSNTAGRLDDGDLAPLRPWFDSFVRADIRVESVVSIIGAPRERLLAHRAGDSGFLAIQRSEEQIVEVFETSPFDLGAVVAAHVGLDRPGTHPRIVVPEFRRKRTATSDGEDYTLRPERRERSASLPVSRNRVLKYCRVQSRWKSPRDWGFDREKNMAVWVHVVDDGDYLYSPKFDYLSPVRAPQLSDRIDQLIAEDVAELRHDRRG